MSTQTVYFDNPADIVNLQTTTSTHTSQISSMSGSIATLQTQVSSLSRYISITGTTATLSSNTYNIWYLPPINGFTGVCSIFNIPS
jgi:hypothetical protein